MNSKPKPKLRFGLPKSAEIQFWIRAQAGFAISKGRVLFEAVDSFLVIICKSRKKLAVQYFTGKQLGLSGSTVGLSAAFDTVDHAILLEHLSKCFGIHGCVLQWIKRATTGRMLSFKVMLRRHLPIFAYLDHSTELRRASSFSGPRVSTAIGYQSPLPLTDPRDAEAQCMLNIPYPVMW